MLICTDNRAQRYLFIPRQGHESLLDTLPGLSQEDISPIVQVGPQHHEFTETVLWGAKQTESLIWGMTLTVGYQERAF